MCMCCHLVLKSKDLSLDAFGVVYCVPVSGRPVYQPRALLMMLRERNDKAWISHLKGCPDIASGKCKYRLFSKLGEGKFGTVWCAGFRQEVQANVAVKIPKARSKDDVAWVAAELQIMLTVAGHKNVLSLREAFYSPDADEGPRVPADVRLLTFVYATCAPRSVLFFSPFLCSFLGTRSSNKSNTFSQVVA